MAELIAPVLTSLLRELRSAIDDLKQSKEVGRCEIAMSICVLSREIRFELGPPDEVQPSLVTKLVALFEEAAHEIEISGDDTVRVYADNIRVRATAIAGS